MAHDRLIADLFADKGERQTVHAIVAALPRTMTEDRTVALIHELARPAPDGQTGEQSAAYIASFIGAIGGMEHEQAAFSNWVAAGGPGAFLDPEPAPPEEAAGDGTTAIDPAAAPVPPAAPPVPAGPTRAELQAQIAKHESDMRAEPGSEPWRDYWRHGGAEQCLAARRALETAEMSPAAAEPAA
jgi:hypothetical protein